ncbi:glutamate-cysteine ligase [Buchnera aphidicola str. Bp (Baizongia pistaciae)]|uniref:Glutamate--cysteine ligase n=1 Tax=Buchnera aphidicola subsp. Baizongia pistaciae (strain Bp) TaxID=224915 RepID=GSH1_BUCBP|nr:glutamate--cysteine ligase [Buchnera aphidicola]Q89AD8.1 RecName: Full=Glutamate--cysteine ligase; AltName: Full=Gamma-ECS; Short=GCS; AltName: Full=Gamma-glutamylcysteine synthetase [Buchnera aphidicola str. Bp (Baizongia pistaciae)]AAO27085.1 glutamate-cysteine ligase [Buchnera aphidicola str. Bp (Baizongia pistaciae)]
MIPKIYKKIKWLQSNPLILKKILRGIEREALRTDIHGTIINTAYPQDKIGSALTHKWITTDFSESLLEFITPTNASTNYILKFLNDTHKFVNDNLIQEYFWPFSIPPCKKYMHSIKLSKYGTSNLGQVKTLYRKGLKHRYGILMNIISGVHYNFSLPRIFWNHWKKIHHKNTQYNTTSEGYLCLIRNYYKFGWIIPYLFGASPAVEPLFIKNKKHNYKFKKHHGMLYLPWSTSLRLSDLGHTNQSIKKLKLTFNSLSEYVLALEHGIKTPSKQFKNLGLYDQFGNFKQINTNLLQTENELYTYIRPKQKLKNCESLSAALRNRGIEYVEIRALDINPFTSTGVDKNQILLLDLFLIWCVLADSPKISSQEFHFFLKNWHTIITKGRKPKQKININIYNTKNTIQTIGKTILYDLFYIAEILDSLSNNNNYQETCKNLILYFDYPELTYSEKLLNKFMCYGIYETGANLFVKYKQKLHNDSFKILSKKDLNNEMMKSNNSQKLIEKQDTLNFKEYLNLYYTK